MKLVILAAGQGTRLKPLTNNKPKCLAPLLDIPLLQWQIDAALAVGIKEIIVVGGYHIEQLQPYPVTLVNNKAFHSTNMVYSLHCAKAYLNDDIIVSYGDIVYEAAILEKLIHTNNDITVVVDSLWRAYWEMRFDDPLSDAETLDFYANGCIKEIGRKAQNLEGIKAQYIGLCFYKQSGMQRLIQTYEQICIKDNQRAKNLYMTDLLQEMINQGINIHSLCIKRGWYEIDSLHDLALAQRLMQASFIDQE
ncbi:MAG: phosphocholine cytidylyltransferase family protein [Proteobacteria bacterium]|nr:phosphocholine cytidylyltransferase family protein [Pseudomonadota bacterium]